MLLLYQTINRELLSHDLLVDEATSIFLLINAPSKQK